MEPSSILTIILLCFIGVERLIKHVKKSKCCNSEIDFDTNISAPDLLSYHK